MSGAIKASLAPCQPQFRWRPHTGALPAAATAGRGAGVPVCGRQVKEQRVEVEEAVQHAFFVGRDQALAPATDRQRRKPRTRRREVSAGGGERMRSE